MAGKYRNYWYFICKNLFSLLPDVLYHNVLGFIMHKRFNISYKWMDINKPKTFSEKLQYFKKYPISSDLVQLTDKYSVRDYVKEKVGEDVLIPLIGKGIYNTLDEINFDELPNEFVLKLTKGSGYNLICTDKQLLNKQDFFNTINKWLSIDPFYMSRESQYKGKSRIIIEKLLDSNITDYKFFCFNGVVEFVELICDRSIEQRKMFYDLDWNKLPFTTGGGKHDINDNIEKPDNFNELVSIANKLAKDFLFVRVDLYSHKNSVYFGELTFYPSGGYTPIIPKYWDTKLGEMIKN